MKNYVYGLIGLICVTPVTLLADDDDREICTGSAPPILNVADFNGDGVVSDADIVIIRKVIEKENYYAFYDLNADGRLNRQDILKAKQDLGLRSQPTERFLAYMFHRNKQYQLIDTAEELSATGFAAITPALSGHGEHWDDFIQDGEADIWNPDGVNYSAESHTVKGMYWNKSAIPVFEQGATDYPTPGGQWQSQRVVGFADHPPRFTGSPDEKWHTHAGLCITAEGTFENPVISLNQHTTFEECQSLPSIYKDPNTNLNPWFNIWMLHAWMFDLNPNGVFAGTHPCADPNAPSESSINGDRPVPSFFQQHH
ncbi:MAG: dockerin type I domain-containing protein [Gammaproteobacteria bacterium]|nr:dockerin type I domain-containing protein [Gammaproteobacteria bacterium]MDH5802567.1 dockerin type I domain-containing protein [Gammaproteobacteria bacterium]